MALVLSEEQSMLRDSARGLISDKAPVSHLRQLRDSNDATGFSRDPEFAAYDTCPKSRVAWDCCSKRVVNLI